MARISWDGYRLPNVGIVHFDSFWHTYIYMIIYDYICVLTIVDPFCLIMTMISYDYDYNYNILITTV